jgi:RNA polymerase sigma factor (sigma-70 family)
MGSSTVSAAWTDQQLAEAAGAGEAEAFEELYRRHLPAATGVALAVLGHRDDARDAVAEGFARVLGALPSTPTRTFRSYLLTSTRHAAIDILRRSNRVRPTDDLDALDDHAGGGDPAERTLSREDAAMLARAFASLPERWRSVLWLVEVEQLPTREVARALGLTPNNVAQIGVRARSRLRERYVQAHLGPDADSGCQFTARRLGAHLTATLGRRDLTKVDDHLRSCAVCRHRRADLEDMGLKLRSALPVPLTVLSALRARARAHPVAEPVLRASPSVQSAMATVRVAVGSGVSQMSALSAGAPLVERLVAVASVAVVAIGVSTLAVRTDVTGSRPSPSATTSTGSTGSGPAGPGSGTGLLGAGAGAGSGSGGGTAPVEPVEPAALVPGLGLPASGTAPTRGLLSVAAGVTSPAPALPVGSVLTDVVPQVSLPPTNVPDVVPLVVTPVADATPSAVVVPQVVTTVTDDVPVITAPSVPSVPPADVGLPVTPAGR